MCVQEVPLCCMRFLPFFTLFVLTQCFIYTVRCVVVLLSCLVCAIACLLFIQYFENQGVWSGFVPTTAQTYGSTVSVHVVTKEFQHIIGTGTAVQNYQMSGFTLSLRSFPNICVGNCCCQIMDWMVGISFSQTGLSGCS